MYKQIIALLVTIPFITLSLYTYNFHYKPQKHLSSADTIAAIMNYKMPHVIARCQKDHNYTNDDMVILEQELKRYLALSAIMQKEDLGTGMYSGDVDNLWHAFILFTAEYADFCQKHIGYFVHHMPELEDFKDRSKEKRAASQKDFQAFIKNYEKAFNEEIHPIWFLDMC
jgi:hypothetical protein